MFHNLLLRTSSSGLDRPRAKTKSMKPGKMYPVLKYIPVHEKLGKGRRCRIQGFHGYCVRSRLHVANVRGFLRSRRQGQDINYFLVQFFSSVNQVGIVVKNCQAARCNVSQILECQNPLSDNFMYIRKV